MSVCDYFLQAYKIRIQYPDQPLFRAKNKVRDQQDVLLPPELCTLDGVPEQVRSNKNNFRELLQASRKNPKEKLQDIQKFTKQLFNQKPLQKWGIKIETKPIVFDCNILDMPKTIDANKNMTVFNPQQMR